MRPAHTETKTRSSRARAPLSVPTLALAAFLTAGSAAGERARTLGDLLAELTVDPTVEEVQRAALEQAALEPARMRSLLARLRWAAALPTVEVSVARGLERDEDLDRQYQEWDELSVTTDDDVDLRCAVRWDLDRLVYDPEELRAARGAADLSRRRRELLLAVTRLYYELVLLRAQEQLGAEEPAEARLERALRMAEVRALLDGMTGGLMSGRAATGRRRR